VAQTPEERLAKRRAYRARNSEKIRAQARARYAADPEGRAKSREWGRKWTAANPARRRKIGNRWRAAHPEQARAWRAKNLEHARTFDRKKRGVSEPTRPRPAVCECCGGPPGKKGMYVDHCHVSGQFRGWLCTNCNSGIGLLGDDIQGATNALNYMKRATQ
jgi:hypothetical protein